jgi:hypothetical protein
MKKIAVAAIVGSGLAAALLGLAAPIASAADAPPVAASTIQTKIGIDHLDWLDDIRPKVNIPQVESSVQHREIRVPMAP